MVLDRVLQAIRSRRIIAIRNDSRITATVAQQSTFEFLVAPQLLAEFHILPAKEMLRSFNIRSWDVIDERPTLIPVGGVSSTANLKNAAEVRSLDVRWLLA